MSDHAPRELVVKEVVRETHDAHSIVFEGPPMDYKPGQFLTLRIPSDRELTARCYSLSSSPYVDDLLKVTVKRTVDGYGSNWVCDNVAPGSTVEVLPPAGHFTPRDLGADLLLFAGGSGITPVISIIKSALKRGRGRLALVYANRDEASVIFGAELAELSRRHPDRLVVLHWLETVQGLPTAAQVAELVRPYADGREAFVCGPGPYMDAVKVALTDLGVPRPLVHVEKFVSLSGSAWGEPVRPVVLDDLLATAERAEPEPAHRPGPPGRRARLPAGPGDGRAGPVLPARRVGQHVKDHLRRSGGVRLDDVRLPHGPRLTRRSSP
jgi:3-ketosteroid 9alpha-monooxygenase subunit B